MLHAVAPANAGVSCRMRTLSNPEIPVVAGMTLNG